MLEIKLDNVDKLNKLMSDFSVISYLECLVRSDEAGHIILDDNMSFARERAGYYLYDRQFETVLKLREILEEENFVFKVSRQ